MKKQLVSLCAALFFAIVPAVGHGATIDDTFEVLQLQILSAHHRGDQREVIELFSIMLELLWSDSLRQASVETDAVEVQTGEAEGIDTRSARVYTQIDWNRASRGYVWFEYGEDREDLDHETPRERIDQYDDEYQDTLFGLDYHERYYYRAVVEDRETGELYYGETEHFRTRDKAESPELETYRARELTDEEAQLGGWVDMHDYQDGTVFFVWGEDEDQVEDVARRYDDYHEIDEDGDDLQKDRVDTRLDGYQEYHLDVDRLEEDTRYYFSLCLEYENADERDVLVCGDTEDFETRR